MEPAIFKQSNQAIEDNFATDLLQNLAIDLFSLTGTVWKEFPCAEDPRGFVFVYGTDSDNSFACSGIKIQTLTSFFDHLSFIIPEFNIDCIVSPESNGLHIQCFNHLSQEMFREEIIKSDNETFCNFISSLCE